jgi:hypothetical protein
MGSWKLIRGIVAAATVAILCVIASARIIEWQDYPQPIRAPWPHMDPLAMVAVLAPAGAFWFVYFARYWRGPETIAGCWRPLVTRPVKSFLWLVIIFELCLLFLAATSRAVR